MRLESRKYLYDIHEAAGLLRAFTASKSFEDYEQDPMLRAVLEANLRRLGFGK